MGVLNYSSKTKADLYKEFNTGENGLTSDTAKLLIEKFGENRISSQAVGWRQILSRQFKSAFVYLLIVAAGLAFLLGERLDGIIILGIVILNSSLSFYQEYRSEKTLSLLKKFITSTSRVLRSGTIIKIEDANIVPGDIVLLRPGDKIPADVRFIDSYDLAVDESILTGESVPAAKTHIQVKTNSDGEERGENIGYSGTLVVKGEARALVLATGESTNYAEIVRLATQTEKHSTYEKEISRFSSFTLKLVIVAVVFLILGNIVLKGTGEIGRLLIFSIALAVSVIPEALPVVTTFCLSLGGLKLAKNGVVVKRLSAIDDLGSIQVLASDKTGTLTENVLEVQGIFSGSSPDVFFVANLASAELEEELEKEAFDKALIKKLSIEEREGLKKFRRVKEIPFDPDRRRVTVLCEADGKVILISRGAPDDVLPLCEMGKDEKKKLLQWIIKKGKEGVRVLAVAKKELGPGAHKDLQAEEHDLTFLGAIAFTDPIKESTFEAVTEAEKLGVRLVILTGDSPEVAGAVAYKIRLIESPDKVTSGKEFESLSFDEQHKAVEKFDVFARVSPQQKHQIIKILQEKYEVGFLGEGINDAPALKIANVALVVQSVSDIGKEIADIVLLEKDLKVIVDGIRIGRGVFANTDKYITATLSANFGNFFAVGAASFVINYLPMLPIQILMVNLLSDFPMISVATDNVDQESLKYPRVFDLKNFAGVALVLGAVSTIYDFALFGLFRGFPPGVLQTAWFVGSILTELVFIFSIRTRFFFLKGKRPSITLLLLAIFAAVVTIALPLTYFGATYLKFAHLTTQQYVIIFSLVTAYFSTTEVIKVLYYKFFSEPKRPTAVA